MRTRTLIRENRGMLILAASGAILMFFLIASELAAVEATRQGRSGPPMPEGIVEGLLGLAQFYLVGLPAATIVTSVDFFRLRKGLDGPARLRLNITLVLCVLAWLAPLLALTLGRFR